jgi:colicin import membrane protein
MRKSKIYGIVGTTLFAGLVLLLFFLVQFTSIQDNYTEPVEVINLGDSEDGVGAAVPDPAPPTSAVPPPPSTHKQKSMDENLANQLDESPVTTVEKKKATVVKQTPQQLEENRKKIQQELMKQQQAKAEAAQQAAVADKARKMGSVFGSNHGNGSGDGQKGNGTKGNPLGKAGGTGVSVSVAGRSVTSTPSPAYNSNDEGKVTVNVTVDKEGNVIRAYIGSATTSSEVLREAALQAARRSKFSSGANEAIGTITYRFILK